MQHALAKKTPTEVLQAALDRETQSHDFYEVSASVCHVDFVKDLLLTLQREEARHMSLIRHMIARLEAEV